MAGERYRHIYLSGPTRSRGFTNPRGFGPSNKLIDRERAKHGVYLQRKLNEAWSEVERRTAVSHVEREGAYIEFESEPGFNLAIQSLENMRSGIRLRNVRKIGEEGKERTLATVYIPHNCRGQFLKKLQAYTTENDKRNQRPKNEKLVNNISDIRLAILESFWSDKEKGLIPNVPEWIEVWLGSDNDEIVERFISLLKQLNIAFTEGKLRFPERTVMLIKTDRHHLLQLIDVSDDIAEFRLAKEVATFYIQRENRDQLEKVRAFLKRCHFSNEGQVVVCILDTGINNGHLLIQPVLDDADLHTVRQGWGTNDDDGHGTLMAGTVAYGDLLSILNENGQVRVDHCLESVKILPPSPVLNPKELWGYLTIQGISLAEIHSPQRKRIICMAITAPDDSDRGRPSSWSSAIDAVASGYDDQKQRLIILSAGNVIPDNWRNYPESNLTSEVQDPGQSWNALTVGAFTEKTRITDTTLNGYAPIAPSGGLSPYSTTSTTWPSRKWPIKPEVVFEGGNVARGPNNSIIDSDDLKLISTNRDTQTAQFAPFWATSAASAQAAWMAAQIQSQYPESWPETIRALIVHTSKWNEAMKEQFLGRTQSRQSYAKLLSVCGYGVPSLERALYCAADSLTLISQAVLQPYTKNDEGRYITKDMHLYELPWPSDVLASLGEMEVEMKVTLSYFIEPGPGEVGWDNRYRYASHGLRFALNGPNESTTEFMRRINKQAQDDEDHPATVGPGDKWVIGETRNVGSIHSDIWQGRAADLATSNKIAVYPAIGWWRERAHLKRWNRQSRYSLIVSIITQGVQVDIYTPVAIKVGIAIPVSIVSS